MRDKLAKTIGAQGSRTLYFFSPNHTEAGDRYEHRKWHDDLIGKGLIARPHDFGNPAGEGMDFDRLLRPDYRAHYSRPQWGINWPDGAPAKPLCMINNKYSMEWGGPPVNYIGVAELVEIMEVLRERYHVVYVRPTGRERSYGRDNQPIYDYADMGPMQAAGATLIQDLLQANPNHTFNDLQFALGARSEFFVSAAGSNAKICSLFGGTNVVLLNRSWNKPGMLGWWGQISGCEISCAPSSSFVKLVKDKLNA